MTGDDLRRLCLAFPGATEKETWGDAEHAGDVTFRVRDRIFVMMGPDGAGASIRTTIDEQADLISAFPEAFRVAAYVGRFGWVSVRLADVPDPVLRDVVERAWRRTAPRAAVAAWDEARA